ncbi:MAG: Flp pilus assembly protein CpaB [Planctomycetota bacterium]|jgi:pilus assembly protein CpaB
MKWAIIALIILGILAALSAALLVNALRSESEATLSGRGVVKAVVAKRSLPAMSWITSQHIEVKEIKKMGLAADYFSDPVQVVGKVLAVPILKDQVLTRSALISEGSGAQLAAALPTGMRAVSVPVSKHSVMGGLLYPGCLVDVIATFQLRGGREAKGEAISTTLLRGIQVLAVQAESIVSKADEQQQQTKVTASGRDLTVTLMVDSRQAEALQLAMNNGQITLAMRNPLDQEDIASDAMVLSQGRLAKLGQLLGSTVSTTGGRMPEFNEDRELVLIDPNDPNQPEQKISNAPMRGTERFERFFGNTFSGSTRSPQWQITVIRGKEVKEEILEAAEPGAVSEE